VEPPERLPTGGLTPRRSPGESIRAVQMHDRYIVAEVSEGVLLLDQHALHERLLFEQMRERFEAGRLEVQKLLVPETVHLSPTDAARIVAHRDDLAGLGLEIEGFGGGTVLLSGYPAALGRHAPRDVLRGVARHLAELGGAPPRDVLLDGLMALVACHAAVRAGERLPPDLVRELAAQHGLAENSHHCPHGRPSSLLLTSADLDRQFGRT
ncbi:MAG: DNA mismatch repair protein MutL, partial [Gemmataceae bacterium]|nr:DNA mismatch repair protein MutL [Gemmataceae bacterium]